MASNPESHRESSAQSAAAAEYVAPADPGDGQGLLRPALVLFCSLFVLTGLIYPLTVTALAQLIFPQQANGSLIHRRDELVGSRLIGQQFTAAGYFWSRPSATTPMPYNAAASAGANLGPTNPVLLADVRARVAALKAADPGQRGAVPIDLVTASASGLDPDISLAAAYYQAARVARARHLPLARVRALVARHAKGIVWGFLGEPHVNVLELNLALDADRP